MILKFLTLLIHSGAQLDILLGGEGGKGEIFFLPPPPLTLLEGGKTNVYYTQTINKRTLPTQGQDSWIDKLQNRVDFLPPPLQGGGKPS